MRQVASCSISSAGLLVRSLSMHSKKGVIHGTSYLQAGVTPAATKPGFIKLLQQALQKLI